MSVKKYVLISLGTTLMLGLSMWALWFDIETAEATAPTYSEWSMNEGSGNLVADVNWLNNGTRDSVYPPSWFTSGSITGLNFSGGSQFVQGDHVDVPHSPELEGLNGFHIYAKIKIIRDSYTYHAICDKYYHTSSADYGYTLYLTNGKLRLSIYGGSLGQVNLFSREVLPTNRWIIVEGGWNSGLNLMYVNWFNVTGNQEYHIQTRTQTWGPASPPVKPVFCIGERSTGWGGYMPFHGEMDYLGFDW